MKILLTGGTSGIGQALLNLLCRDHDVVAPSRTDLNLADYRQIDNFVLESVDMLINCAGTGVGGKIDFINHNSECIKEILQVNLVSVVLLTQKVLSTNPLAKIVNITSTNNKQYHPGDLAYSLSKQALADFGNMLKIEYPNVPVLEVQVGLTKTNFNKNRYQREPNRYQEIYKSLYLTPEQVAHDIHCVMFDNSINFIEISP